jgi:hypothetical protein
LNSEACIASLGFDTGRKAQSDGIPGLHQGFDGLLMGELLCAALLDNANEAEAMMKSLINDGELEGGYDANAFLHAYWFALNSFDLILGEEGPIAFGESHEQDWRDIWTGREISPTTEWESTWAWSR